MRTGTRARSACLLIVSALLLATLTQAGRAELVRWSAAEGGNDHFYQVVAMGGPITWMEANDLAQLLGGHLVTITSEAENEFVFRLIDDDQYWFKGINWRGPWIGAYQPVGSPEPAGNWCWVTGEPFAYQNWDAGQPNNFNGSPEDYAVFGNQQRRVRTWNDVTGDFAEIVSFVLEYSDPDTRPIQWLASAGGNRHFYKVVCIPDGLTWDQAKGMAEMAGGYLATITSAQENAFVFSLMQDPAYWNGARGPWIGGYQLPGRPLREGWQWVTGEPFVYTNWSPGQPNDSGGADETRLHFGWGATTIADTWNDQPDWWAGIYSFVLEVGAGGSAADWPGLGRIDYDNPSAHLTLHTCLGSSRVVQKVAAQVKGATAVETLIRIGDWLETNLASDPAKARAWHDLDNMLKTGTYGGEAGRALAVGTLTRACGIPTVWVKAMDNDWISEYQFAGTDALDCRGHVFLELFIEDQWLLLDPALMMLYPHYNPASHAFPGRRYAYDKGDNAEELILPLQYDRWKQQALVYFENFDLSALAGFGYGLDLSLFSVYAAAQEPAGHWITTRCEELGYQVGECLDANSFGRSVPTFTGHALVIACLAGEVSVPAEYQDQYLPQPLEQIRALMDQTPHGILTRLLADGTNVILVYGKDQDDLRAAIEELSF